MTNEGPRKSEEDKPRGSRWLKWRGSLRRILARVLGDAVAGTISDLIGSGLKTVGGLGLAFVLSGFGDLTLTLRSWTWFGWYNSAGDPGSRMRADSVYDVPFDTRYRVDGGLLLSVGRDRYGHAIASLTTADGSSDIRRITANASLTKTADCRTISVHLMRPVEPKAERMYVMYTSQRQATDDCRRGWFGLLG